MTQVVDTSERDARPVYDEQWFAQRGIEDERVIQAILETPRRPFVRVEGEEENLELLPLTGLLPVEVAAKLLSALEVREGVKVLEVGTESGYLTALLARLGAQVFSVERRLALAKLAERRLEELGVEGVEILYGPKLTEYALNAPYGGILLTAVVPRVPDKLLSRLAIGGRMVVPVARGEEHPEVICIERVGEEQFETQSLGQLRFSSMLGEILVELGVADRDDVELAALEADASGKRLGEALLQFAQIQERDLVRALSIQRGLKIAPVDTLLSISDHELAYSVPRAFLEHHQILPLVVQDRILTVATVDPDSPGEELAQILEARSVETYLVTTEEFKRLWNTLLEGRRPLNVQADSLKARVEAKFEAALRRATQMQAAMIHFENHASGGEVRMRVGSELLSVPELRFEPAEVSFLVEYLKIGAGLNTLEQRIPQKGRFTWIRDPVTFYLHIHVMPSIMGEQVAVQLLTHGEQVPSLEEIGFAQETIVAIDELLALGRGLLLIVGPRHVGKRETLYALMNRIARDERIKAAMLEENILYPMEKVQQALVQSEGDFGYEQAINEFARFGVDALGLGEIRSPQVALEALQVARRGPMMVGVLQGRDSVYVLQGLREFGVPAEALAGGITAILTQRLAAKNCEECREQYTPDSSTMEALFPHGAPMNFRAFRGRGCRACGNRGLRGYVPVLELLPMSDLVRQAIIADENENLRALVLETGLETLAECAVRLVREGQIPIEELANYIPFRG